MSVEVALKTAIAEGEIIVRWVTVVEALDLESNERRLYTDNEESMQDWEVKGLLLEGVRMTDEEDEGGDLDD